LFTLRVVGSAALRHPLDRFALCLSRALASAVVYSGRVLREEPELQCAYDEPLAGGLQQLRRAHGLAPLPAVCVVTRASQLGDFPSRHPLLDHASAAEQSVSIWHSDPALRKGIVDQMHEDGSKAVQNAPSTASAASHDSISLPLADLLRLSANAQDDSLRIAASASAASSDGAGPHHPSKPIRLMCSHGADTRTLMQRMQQQARDSSAVSAAAPFLSHVSIEAGPAFTSDLYSGPFPQPAEEVSNRNRIYSNDSEAADDTAGPKHRAPPLVKTLLLTVYNGILTPEQLRSQLVWPAASSHAHADPSAPHWPPPTLTLPYLRRHYRLLSQYQCPHDPNWTFAWLERK